jgi:3-deoxy-manno-octulosonate cytidylyltransferase (CMP-KDO synthetase)
MKVAAVIPARMQSTRLPGKPLLKIAGVPMILRVLDRARECRELERIIVATDSEEIYRVVEAEGGEPRMTSPLHRTGSDRVAEVAETLSEEYVLNLQGDEPLLPPLIIKELLRFAADRPDLLVATAMTPLPRAADIVNPNIVKVVADKTGRALYFSRFPIPYCKRSPLDLKTDLHSDRTFPGYFKHVGIYLYRRTFLLDYVKMASTPMEISESLEQLRILESGYPVHIVQVQEDSISVDTSEDLKQVESLIMSRWSR